MLTLDSSLRYHSFAVHVDRLDCRCAFRGCVVLVHFENQIGFLNENTQPKHGLEILANLLLKPLASKAQTALFGKRWFEKCVDMVFEACIFQE